ncbi:MAG: hypothetical protein JXA60_02420 [Candidatus Coatesbacteria bacterium]|nr:hypothetical protein [Candidatus Coatesbacteria bacterium]
MAHKKTIQKMIIILLLAFANSIHAEQELSFQLGAMYLCRYKSRIYNEAAAKVAIKMGIRNSQYFLSFPDYYAASGFNPQKLKDELEKTAAFWIRRNNENTVFIVLSTAMPEISSVKSRMGIGFYEYPKNGHIYRWAPSDSSYIFINERIPFDSIRNQQTYEYFCYSVAKSFMEIFKDNPENCFKKVKFIIGNEYWFIFECATGVKKGNGQIGVGAAPLYIKLAMTRAAMRGLKRALVQYDKWKGNLKKLDELDCPSEVFWGNLECSGPRQSLIKWQDWNSDINNQAGSDYSYALSDMFCEEVRKIRKNYKNDEIGISQIFFNSVSVHLYRFKYRSPYEAIQYNFGSGRNPGVPMTLRSEIEWCRDFLRKYKKFGMPQNLAITEFGYPQIARLDVVDEYRRDNKVFPEWGKILSYDMNSNRDIIDLYAEYINDLWRTFLSGKYKIPDWYGDFVKVKTKLLSNFSKNENISKSIIARTPILNELKTARLMNEYIHIVNDWNNENRDFPVTHLVYYCFSTGIYPDLALPWHYYGLMHNPNKKNGHLIGTSGIDFGEWLAPLSIAGLSLIRKDTNRLSLIQPESKIPFQSSLKYDTCSQFCQFIFPEGEYEITLNYDYPNTLSKVKGADENYFKYIPWNYNRGYENLKEGERDLYVFIGKDYPFFKNTLPNPVIVLKANKKNATWTGRINSLDKVIITENPNFWSENNAKTKWGYPSGYIWGSLKIRKIK